MVTARNDRAAGFQGQGGDAVEREEFAGFYAASFQRLVGQLHAMIGDQAEAQDVVQEAFVRAWARRGKIDSERGARGLGPRHRLAHRSPAPDSHQPTPV
jgi:hypothetical protein